MVNWVKVGTDVAVGGAVGAVDQLVQNADTKRIIKYVPTPDKPKLGMMSQYGTYYNYGVPILAILGVAFNFLRGDWATRAVVAGSQLAGRKVTKQVTAKSMTEEGAVPYTAWGRQRSLEAAKQRALAAEGARAQIGGGISEVTIPIVADETMLV